MRGVTTERKEWDGRCRSIFKNPFQYSGSEYSNSMRFRRDIIARTRYVLARFRSLMSVCTSLDTLSRHYPSRVPMAINTALHTEPSSRDAFKCRRRTIIVIINIIVSATCVTSIVSTPGGRDDVATWPEEHISRMRKKRLFSDISVKQDDKGNREDTRHEEHYGYVQRCAVKRDKWTIGVGENVI